MPTQEVNLPEQINGFMGAYIDGLNINWVTSGSISVQPGTAFIPSLNTCLSVTGAITQSIPIVATTVSGSWQHVFLYENNGSAAIQVTGTSPSVPYSGVARTKTGDVSKRYIGSVYCDAGGYLYQFNSDVLGNVWDINWMTNNNIFPFQFGNVSGTVSIPTVLSVSWLVPSVARLVIEMYVQIIHSLAAGGDNIASITDGDIAETVPQNVNADLLTRLANGLATTANLQVARANIKISSNSFKYTHSNIVGTNAAFFRARGVRIQR